jgi:hypothetical protein
MLVSPSTCIMYLLLVKHYASFLSFIKCLSSLICFSLPGELQFLKQSASDYVTKFDPSFNVSCLYMAQYLPIIPEYIYCPSILSKYSHGFILLLLYNFWTLYTYLSSLMPGVPFTRSVEAAVL